MASLMIPYSVCCDVRSRRERFSSGLVSYNRTLQIGISKNLSCSRVQQRNLTGEQQQQQQQQQQKKKKKKKNAKVTECSIHGSIGVHPTINDSDSEGPPAFEDVPHLSNYLPHLPVNTLLFSFLLYKFMLCTLF